MNIKMLVQIQRWGEKTSILKVNILTHFVKTYINVYHQDHVTSTNTRMYMRM